MGSSELIAAKDYWSKNHAQSPRVMPRDAGHNHRYAVAEFIRSLSPAPASVLEFGCSSGRNLAVLQAELDRYGLGADAHLCGIDINEQALTAGRTAHPDIDFRLGDEALLASMPDGAFDVVFTVSVLDHIPAPDWQRVYDELSRVARYHLVLLEPVAIDPDKGGQVEVDCVDINLPAPPFTYLHDYLGHDPYLSTARPLPVNGLDRWADFGRLYSLMYRG